MNEPKFWMWETTGQMKEIVFKYLESKPLTESEFALLKAYVRQWIEGTLNRVMPFNPDPGYKIRMIALIEELDLINTNSGLYDFINQSLLPIGIDPF